MSSIARKLAKLRRDPSVFVYDYVARHARLGRAPARWLLGQLVEVPTKQLVDMTLAGQTISPLEKWLTTRYALYGREQTVRAATRAIERIARDHQARSASNLYLAVLRAESQVDIEEAGRIAIAHVAVLGNPAIKPLLLGLEERGELHRAISNLERLEAEDLIAHFESILYGAEYNERYGAEVASARAAGDEALSDALDKIISTEGTIHAFHYVYSAVIDDYRKRRERAALVTRFGEQLLERLPRNSTAFQVADAYLNQGAISDAVRVLERWADLKRPRSREKLEQAQDLARLRDRGFDYRLASTSAYEPRPGTVFFGLHHSAPHHSNGYATRAHGLLVALQQGAWQVDGVTRLGYPQDLSPLANEPKRGRDEVDGVTYLRLPGSGHIKTPLHTYLERYADALHELARKERPQLLHAHSNAINGVAANVVARALGIKSIYEIRGLWEVTRASRQPAFTGSEHYEMLRDLEAQAAREADAVVCITEGLKAEMIERGVDGDKITIVPNGVDPERFVPRPRDEALAHELGLTGKPVIGYVGSLVDYEGLDDLLSAVAMVVERGRDLAVMIVGDGVSRPALQKQVKELGLSKHVRFTGRVPHDQVERYYSVVDIAPFPRKSLPVTEMVSPLKPFEAMAMGKIVVASDVAALAEIVEDGVNGFLFSKDDVAALAVALERALDSVDSNLDESFDPRAWVIEHRSWRQMAMRLEALYSLLVE